MACGFEAETGVCACYYDRFAGEGLWGGRLGGIEELGFEEGWEGCHGGGVWYVVCRRWNVKSQIRSFCLEGETEFRPKARKMTKGGLRYCDRLFALILHGRPTSADFRTNNAKRETQIFAGSEVFVRLVRVRS
jgi:hypothetical protein